MSSNEEHRSWLELTITLILALIAALALIAFSHIYPRLVPGSSWLHETR